MNWLEECDNFQKHGHKEKSSGTLYIDDFILIMQSVLYKKILNAFIKSNINLSFYKHAPHTTPNIHVAELMVEHTSYRFLLYVYIYILQYWLCFLFVF